MIPGSDSIVHQSPMIIYTNSKMNIMNISKNGKIKGSLSRGNLKLSLKVEEKELTEKELISLKGEVEAAMYPYEQLHYPISLGLML